MLRRVLGVLGALLLGGLLVLSDGCTPSLGGDCPQSECSGYGSYCQGNKVMNCVAYEGDPCLYNYLTEEDDCGARGQKCVDGSCTVALAGKACPNGGDGVCANNVAYRCDATGHLDMGEPCATPTQCWQIPADGGGVVAACAIEPHACDHTAGDGSECNNDDRVVCRQGYPVERHPCPGDEIVCVENGTAPLLERAQCVAMMP